MAKKTRIDRRGKIRSLTRKRPPIVRLQWRKGKTLAMLANRLQWALEYYPPYTPEVEIISGISTIATEASSDAFPMYIEIE